MRVLGKSHKASMADVALAAGVRRATLHRYYPSRAHLLRALAQQAVAELEAVADIAAIRCVISHRRVKTHSLSHRSTGRTAYPKMDKAALKYPLILEIGWTRSWPTTSISQGFPCPFLISVRYRVLDHHLIIGQRVQTSLVERGLM